MHIPFHQSYKDEIAGLKKDGVYKRLNHIMSPQGPRVMMEGRGEVIVLSSNNYLGLCNHPEVVEAGRKALTDLGAGTSSVRFICGTFGVHRDLERSLARFTGHEAALSYVSCWSANTGLMAALLDERDVIISDALNHASIIDGVRASKAAREVYSHSNLAELEEKLKSHEKARHRFVITDGVFSMEGDIAKLPEIATLCEQYKAVLCVDDSHSTGVLGKTGQGTAEHYGLTGKVDVLTSTLGKALGGAAGGFVASSEAVCDMLTQRSRPQLFSNALAPTIAASALKALQVLEAQPQLLTHLRDNTKYFRSALKEMGLKPLEGETPIVPVIVGETARAIQMSEWLLEEGVFVTGFGFPVVPKGEARLRCQISAAHTRFDLDKVLAAFRKVGLKAGLLGARA